MVQWNPAWWVGSMVSGQPNGHAENTQHQPLSPGHSAQPLLGLLPALGFHFQSPPSVQIASLLQLCHLVSPSLAINL